MIRPRTMVISPLLSIAAVTTMLLGAAWLFSSEAVEPYDYYEEPMPQPVFAIADVPLHFQGTFIWDGQTADQSQRVALDVHELNDASGQLVATGRGTYNTPAGADIDFTFRMEIDPYTQQFTMWESEPDVSAGFVTEGKHVATAYSLDQINARWIGDDGTGGTLTLRATPVSQRVGSLDHVRDEYDTPIRPKVMHETVIF